MYGEIDTGTPQYLREKLDDANGEIARLQQFVDFVNLWCNRTTKVSDSERLSVIKYHPTAQNRLKSRPVT